MHDSLGQCTSLDHDTSICLQVIRLALGRLRDLVAESQLASDLQGSCLPSLLAMPVTGNG